ncbi:BppU family phage baseplate upper protein [Staphylococcus haemolyticus]|uniref:BppU family phage baseplate upper protein n=1 Tax=Staphylococcus haemolyticus TaxID=1283 RepID=UPI001F0A915A|nr:BppU family phage baseplate upper protein [Staphylococcus haemolyticus]MCH4414442.1 BppU family phage baseplate upper protein [Staphylococcus haemolyticus]
MELSKVAKIDLNEEPYLHPISNRDIGFYTMDKNTAQFQFIVKKDKKPLLISNENVNGYAFFKASNGTDSSKPSTSGVIDVDYINPMNGIIGVTVPQWFLKNVANSEVYGEIYLSLNDADNKGKDDTVVLGTFAFTVKESLIDQIESDIKVKYIKMFDDLRDVIEQKIEDLKQDIQATSSMLETIKQTVENAIQSINQAKDDSLNAIDSKKVDALSNINNQIVNSLAQIDSKKNDVQSSFELAQNAIQANVDNQSQVFESKIAEANSIIDDKVNQFKNNGALTKDDVDSLMNGYDWQRSKLTDSNGATLSVTNLDFDDPLTMITTSGFYYLYTPLNGPNASAKNGVLFATFVNNNYIKFIFTPYNSNDIYIRTKVGDSWLAWEKVNDFKDTGWVDLTIVNGTVANTVFSDRNGFKSSFRVVAQNGVVTNHVRLNASNLISGQVIATLPNNIVKNAQSFPVVSSVNKPGCYVNILPSGDIVFYTSSITGEWTKDDYIYSEINFIN